MTKLIFPILLFLNSYQLEAQFTLLKDIAPDASSGLGFSFNGHLNQNGKLSFNGSDNQFNFTIYETDGSAEGTVKTTSAISGSLGTFFSEDLIYIKDQDGGVKLKLFDPETGTVSTINFFDNLDFKSISFMGERALVTGSSNKIYTTDGTDVGSYELPELPGSSFNTKVTTNDSLGLIVDDSFNPNFEPTIIYNNGQSAQELKDYLAPVKEVDRIRDAAIIDELIIIQDVQNGLVENSIYNTNTKEYSSFPYFGPYIEGFRLGEQIIAISTFNIYSIDPSDFSSESLISTEPLAFTDLLTEGGQFYFIASGSEGFQYFESDGTAEGTRELPGTTVSLTSYNPSQVIFENKLVYIKDNGGDGKVLMAFDLETDQLEELGLASEDISGLSTSDGLEVVNGELIVSRYTSELGHELYVYDEMSNSIDLLEQKETISVKSNIVDDQLILESTESYKNISLVDLSGNLLKEFNLRQGENVISISELSTGLYYIVYPLKNGSNRSISFVKI